MPDANVTTTNIEPHQTMHVQSGPTPEEQAARAQAVAPKNDSPDDLSTPGNNPRADIMASIFAKRNAQIEAEMNRVMDEPQPVEAREQSEQVQEPAQAQRQEQPAQQVQTQQPAPQAQHVQAQQLPEVIPVNIGGTVMNISRDELLRLAQTGLQATQVYNEATQLRESAQRLIGAGQQAPQQQQPAPRAQPAPQAQPVFDEARAREISKRLNYGSEEEQAKALSDLGTTIQQAVAAQLSTAQPQLNQNELVNNVSRQVMATVQNQHNLETIASEFADVFNDSELSYAAGYKANMVAQADAKMGRVRPQIEIYREVLTDIRNRYIAPLTSRQPVQPSAGQAPANTNPPVQAATPVAQQMSDRIERKRTAPQPPVAANVRSKGEPEKRYPTNSEIVSQMRKSRGQSAF